MSFVPSACVCHCPLSNGVMHVRPPSVCLSISLPPTSLWEVDQRLAGRKTKAVSAEVSEMKSSSPARGLCVCGVLRVVVVGRCEEEEG